MSNLDLVEEILAVWPVDHRVDHTADCWRYHGPCAIGRLAAEVAHLRAEVQRLEGANGEPVYWRDAYQAFGARKTDAAFVRAFQHLAALYYIGATRPTESEAAHD